MSAENPDSSTWGPVIIVTAPSGSGKTTLVKFLLEVFPQLRFSVSATTRTQRPGEKDGKDYHFLSLAQFSEMKTKNNFIEWEEVYPGQCYGTLRSELEAGWKNGKVMLFDVDVKGALSLKKIFSTQSLSIFLKAPSLSILEERLRKRSTESEDNLRKRLDKATAEFVYQNAFDHIVVNDSLEQAKAQLQEIVTHFLTRTDVSWKHAATNRL